MPSPKTTTPEGTLLWEPTEEQVRHANITYFMEWLNQRKEKDLQTYHQLWEWSVENVAEFWETIWEYYEIEPHQPYDQVLPEKKMPGGEWFPGARLNFADHIFKNMTDKHPALMFQSETHDLQHISWDELYRRTAALAATLRELGVKKGDRVAAYLPNIPEAIIGMLATTSIGAIWSSCSPDFGTDSVIDRFSQIEPKVLLSVDGYTYAGKSHDRLGHTRELQQGLPGLKKIIVAGYLNDKPDLSELEHAVSWQEAEQGTNAQLEFEPVGFNEPLWILYSSGTTGLPKPIVHGHGGMLLEHLKYMDLHANLRPGDRFFWYATTGWMMWNVVVSALLRNSTALLYDGSPVYPDLHVLWKFAEQTRMTCLGTSAGYLMQCAKSRLEPARYYDISTLRSIGSTGSPLPPEGYHWVYEHVGTDIMLNSTSGGTDICSSFVGGNPTLPIYAGEIQCRCLGASVHAYSDRGEPLVDEVGEMVITEPMPCMPLYFWGDKNNERYLESYFQEFPGVWRHGDWIKITERGTCVIYGRSDATLNRQGIRIGTSEIYRAVELDQRIRDSLIVSIQTNDHNWYMPLFVVLREGEQMDEELRSAIRKTIKDRVSPKFIPDDVIAVNDLPYTLSGKKMEKPVKQILSGTPVEKAANTDSMRNPDVMSWFQEFAREKKLVS